MAFEQRLAWTTNSLGGQPQTDTGVEEGCYPDIRGDQLALAELTTGVGTFLIQERRARPRSNPGEVSVASANCILSPQMTALGGLIIIGVLIGSYTTKYDVAIGHRGGALSLPYFGPLALQLFLARAALRGFEEVRTFARPLDFAVNRLLRYLPAVVPGVLLGFAILTFAGVACMNASLTDLPVNLLMVTDMVGGHDIDASHWRLKIEIAQAVMVALAWFTPLRRNLPLALTAGLFICAMTMAGEPVREHSLTLKGIVTCDGYLPLFAFGAALHHIVHDRSSLVWRWTAAASLFLVVLCNPLEQGLIVAVSLIVLATIALGGLKPLGQIRRLVRLGELAFPIYVVHFVTGFAIIQRLEISGAPTLVAILAASSVAITLGTVLNLWFERPIQTRGAMITAALRHAPGFKYRETSPARPALVLKQTIA